MNSAEGAIRFARLRRALSTKNAIIMTKAMAAKTPPAIAPRLGVERVSCAMDFIDVELD